MVFVRSFELLERLGGPQVRHSTTGHHAFFDRSPRGVERILHAGFLLLHLDLGRCAHLDDRHPAGELGDATLEFFPIVVRLGVFSLLAQRLNARADVGGFAGAVDHRRALFLDHHLLGLAEIRERCFLKREANLVRDHLTTGQDGDVLEHGLASIAEFRRLDRRGLEDALEIIDDERRERFALDLFRDDEQRFAGFRHGFEQRQQLAQSCDLLLVQQEQRLFQLCHLNLRLVDEIGRQVAAIKLHAFHRLELILKTRPVLDGDGSFLAHFPHRFGDHLADGGIAVGRYGAHLGNGFGIRAGLRQAFELGHGRVGRQIDSTLQVHGIHAGRDALKPLPHDRLGEYGRGRGAISRFIGGFRGHLLDELRAHVLKLVLELDLLRNRHPVLGHDRCPEALLEQRIATFRA